MASPAASRAARVHSTVSMSSSSSPAARDCRRTALITLAIQYVQLYLMAMARPSLREKIIESGVRTLHERGFAGAGVREITAEAGVPQGCFTNHFRSKEAFAATILDRYHARTQSIIDRTLRDQRRPAVERLHAYFDAIAEWL